MTCGPPRDRGGRGCSDSAFRLTEQQMRTVEDNRFLAIKYVADHLRIHGCADASEHDDLIQEAMIALARAVVSYDPSKGALSTHSHYQMFSAVTRHAHRRHIIYTPEHTWCVGGRDDARRLAVAARSMQSRQLTPRMAIRSTTPADEAAAAEQSEWLRREIESMDEQMRMVLTMRLDGATFQTIADDMGMQRERVSLIEKRAVGLLRASAVHRGFLDSDEAAAAGRIVTWAARPRTPGALGGHGNRLERNQRGPKRKRGGG